MSYRILFAIIWPTNKILPEKWTHWVNDNRSLSQKVIAKITISQGILPQEYWERMLVGLANEEDQPYLWHENYYIVQAICCNL
jgi:hypothetical protein